MDHVTLEHLNGLCKLAGDGAAGVGGQPVAQQSTGCTLVPRWAESKLASLRFCLAKFEGQYGLLEESWPMTQEISCLFLVSSLICWVSVISKLLFLPLLLLLWQFMYPPY